MPFDSSFGDVYELGIKETSTQVGFRTERVDEQKFDESILERIYSQIIACDVVIADMSGRIPNVFYEVGYAHASRKLCILLTRDADDIPFDLKHKRHVIYESIGDLKRKLKTELQWAYDEIAGRKGWPFDIKVNERMGWLEKNEYSATAVISREVVISRSRDTGIRDIDSVWVYTGPNTKVYQGGKLAVCMKSDIGDFSRRHCLALPTARVPLGSWVSFDFDMKKTIAYKKPDEDLLDVYNTLGRILLRMLCGDKAYDISIVIDEDVEDCPF